MVKQISNKDEFMKSIEKNKLNVIDFWATWCGPCLRIAPEFENWSKKYTDVNFFKVNVDESKDLTEYFKIECMPTFLFLKDNILIEKVEGADRKKIEKIIESNLEIIKEEKIIQDDSTEELINEIVDENILSEEN